MPETASPGAAAVAEPSGTEWVGRPDRRAQTDGPPVIWRCYACGASGVLQRPAIETCDITWPRVLAAHEAATPGCHHNGLAVKDGPVPGARRQ